GHIHPGAVRAFHRRRTRAVRLAYFAHRSGRGLQARLARVDATREQRLLCCGGRDGFSWNYFSLGDGRAEPGQVLGGASVLRDRIRTADGTGAISDGYRSACPLEKSESARYRGAPALGPCGEPGRGARDSICNGTL